MVSIFNCNLGALRESEYEETIAKAFVRGDDALDLNTELSAMLCACKNIQLVEHEYDMVPRSEVEALLQEEDYVLALARDPCLVDADLIQVPEDTSAMRPVAQVTPPTRIDLVITEADWPGMPMTVHGPHGDFQTLVPQYAKPGDDMTYYLGPLPEFEVLVPPKAEPGTFINITREDGSAIRVPVPEGMSAGETFHVEPPAVMVKVPEGAAPGMIVYFHTDVWMRARIPTTLRAGGYFAARLPPPGSEELPFIPDDDDDKNDSPLAFVDTPTAPPEDLIAF